MATSSFSRDFVISDPKAIEQLIHDFENPIEIKLKKIDPVEKEKQKKAALCKLKTRLALMTS